MPNDWQTDPGAYLSNLVGSPVQITSGLRSAMHNAAVGGVPNSAHLTGQAFDFVPQGGDMKFAAAKLAQSGVPFDQVINEGNHIHVSFAPTNRRQVLGQNQVSQPGISDDDLLKALTGGKPSSNAVETNTGHVSDDDIIKALTGPSTNKGTPPPKTVAPDNGKGMPFGFGQEVNASIPFAKDAAAGVPALLERGANYLEGKPSQSVSQIYQANLDKLNAQQAEYEKANPGLSGLATGVGIVGSGGTAGGLAKAVPQTLGQLMKGGAKAGATLGGLFGLGTPSEGEQTVSGRAGNALTGAATGGAVGGVLPVVGAVVKPVAKALGGTLAAIGEKTGMVTPNYQARAQNKLLAALGRDNVDPNALATGLSGSNGKPLTAMDLAGTNTQRLGRNLVTSPGEAGDKVTKFLSERSDDQAGRVLGDIGKHLSNNTDVYGVAENLVKERSDKAAPLYKAAFDKPIVTTDRLTEFNSDPDIQAGMKEGIKLARREALAKGKKFDPNAYAITGFNSAGDPEIGPVPTWRTWQAAKEGLDEKIESFRDPVTMRLPNTKAVNSLVDLKNSMVKELDKVNPEYKAARAAWAGPSQSKSAMNMGENFLKADPEEIQQAYSRLSDSDKDFYRIGAARAMQDKANSASDSADLSKRLFGNARVRSQLEAVFGKGAADGFGHAMGAEGAMANTKRFVLGGSNTANKLADAEDSHMELAQDILHGGIHGGPAGAVVVPTMKALGRGIGNLFSGTHPEVQKSIAEHLTSTGQGATTLYEQLAKAQAARTRQSVGRQNMGEAARRLIAGGASRRATDTRSNRQ